jgi:hypothetical protein
MIGAVLGVVALFLLMAPQVRADGVDNFTYTEALGGGNTLVATWSLPSSPTPDIYSLGNGFIFQDDVTFTYSLNGTVTQTTSDANLIFMNADSGSISGAFGGFELANAFLISPLVEGFVLYPASTSSPGVQLFSGPDNAPTFALGTYNLTDVAYGQSNPGILVISTPEPSALLLLLSGLLASALVLGLKRAAA